MGATPVALGLAFVLLANVSGHSIETKYVLDSQEKETWRKVSKVQPSLTIRIAKKVQVRNMLRTETLPDIHYLADRVEKEGDDAHLYCKVDGVVDGKVQMSWKRQIDAKPLLEGPQPFDERIKVRKERHGVIELTITDLKPEDTGNYTCLVQLESGRIVKKTKMLIIEYTTRFSSRQLMLTKYYSLGGSSSITCQADGYPSPSYKWYKDGNKISDNKTFSITNKDGKSSLKIKTSADEDSQWVFGTYSCKATNQHGSAVMQYKLQAAAIPSQTKNFTIKKTRATSVELGVAMPADTGGIPLTGYRVRWMEEVEGTAEGGEGMVSGEGQAHFVSSKVFKMGEPLVVDGLTPGKEYRFEIAALNEAGVGKTIYRTITTAESDEDAAAGTLLYSEDSMGLYPLWIFLAILLFIILLILICLLLWCCGWLTSTALICSPCCAKCCPDCVACCSKLCWCLPLLGCCICCGRTYRGASYDVMKRKKIPLCICCPTDGVVITRAKDNIRLLKLELNNKTGVDSGFSTATRIGAGGTGFNTADSYARNYHLQNDYREKSGTMTSRKTDTMMSRKSDTTRNMMFTYETESSSSSESGLAMNTIETQTGVGGNFTTDSRRIARDHHVTRDVYVEGRKKKVRSRRRPEGPDSTVQYALASDWNRSRSGDILERSYRDEIDMTIPVLRRISKHDERYASQPMVEHLSRRDSVNRDRKRRSSVEVITVYQPGEQPPATRDAKIQIYTCEDDIGAHPRLKLAQLYHDPRAEVDRYQRSSSIPRNVKLSTMVDIGDPTATDHSKERETYTEVRRRKDLTKYGTAPVVRRPKRHTTDEATQTLRRSKYENEMDIPLERFREPQEPQEHVTESIHYVHTEQPVAEVIYKPVTIETKETNTMTRERPQRWSRPPTPPLSAHTGTIYRTFPIEVEHTHSKHTSTERRPPAKPHRSRPREINQQTTRTSLETSHSFDSSAQENVGTQTQTDFSPPIDTDSLTKESHVRWPEAPPPVLQRVAVHPRASPREPEQRGRWSDVDEHLATQTFVSHVHRGTRDPEQRGRRQDVDEPLATQTFLPHAQRGTKDPEDRRRWSDIDEPIATQTFVPHAQKGAPLYLPQHGQEMVEETVIRRQRSIEVLEALDQTEMTAPHQYAVAPEVIFVDSGNYSMEEQAMQQQSTLSTTKSDAEPEHHLAVSPPETHDYYEETAVVETKQEEKATEVKTQETRRETTKQAMEIKSQSAFQEFSASGKDFGNVEDSELSLGGSGVMSRVGGGSLQRSRFGGLITAGGGSQSSTSRFSGSGYSHEAKYSSSGGYSLQGPRVSEARTHIAIEREGSRSSPGYDSRRERQGHWRV